MAIIFLIFAMQKDKFWGLEKCTPSKNRVTIEAWNWLSRDVK